MGDRRCILRCSIAARRLRSPINCKVRAGRSGIRSHTGYSTSRWRGCIGAGVSVGTGLGVRVRTGGRGIWRILRACLKGSEIRRHVREAMDHIGRSRLFVCFPRETRVTIRTMGGIRDTINIGLSTRPKFNMSTDPRVLQLEDKPVVIDSRCKSLPNYPASANCSWQWWGNVVEPKWVTRLICDWGRRRVSTGM
jgi:hypothetical protein